MIWVNENESSLSCCGCAELEQDSHFSEISSSEIRSVHLSQFVLIARNFWKKARLLQKEAHCVILVRMVGTFCESIS